MHSQIAVKENLCTQIREYGQEPYCLEIIQFFGWHPHASFSTHAILHALGAGAGRHYVARTLHRLVDKGMVTTYSENGIRLYCLTQERALRQEALDIAALEWGQRQGMVRQSCSHLWKFMTWREPESAGVAGS